MNFRSSLHQYSAIVLVLLVLANGVHSFSISNEKDDKSNKSNQGETWCYVFCVFGTIQSIVPMNSILE